MDPGLALQDAIEAALRGSADLSELMGDRIRVYSSGAPQDAPMPLIEIGDDVVVGDETECSASSEVTCDIRVWALDDNDVANSRRQAKQIAGVVRGLVQSIAHVAGFHVVLAEFQNARHRVDGDARTAQAVLTFRFLLDPA